MGQIRDFTGHKFGKLTAVRPTDKRDTKRRVVWECLCECGTTCFIPSGEFSKRKTCGCSRGVKNPFPDKVVRLFKNMFARCYRTNHKGFKFYGAIGITICDSWLEDPYKFYDWAIENGWEDGFCIDRIDPKTGYSPSNCRFITREENSARAGGKNIGRVFNDWKILERIEYSRKVIIECVSCSKKRYADQCQVTCLILRPCLCHSKKP